MSNHSLKHTIGYHKASEIATKTPNLTQFFHVPNILGTTGEASSFVRNRFCVSSVCYMLRASGIFWEQFVVDFTTLLEMDSSILICSVNHRWEKHTRAGVDLVPAC